MQERKLRRLGLSVLMLMCTGAEDGLDSRQRPECYRRGLLWVVRV
ncbi:MAG: hypothetical protein VX694_07415 [Planctomycetota bacterium]|nr:hypothetical protein [Planctomycetota bacterium]